MLAFAVGASVVLAQGPGPAFRSGVAVVEVYASVTDDRGAPIAGLGRERFTVREDGVAQPIAAFAEADVPLSIALALDRSWSMAGTPLASARRAGRALIGELRPNDQAMVIAVSARVELVSALSGDRQAALSAIDALDPWSTTALHDAIAGAVDLVQAGSGRRALVIVSDGEDRYSATTAGAVLQHVRSRDVMIYPVATGRREPPLFAELAAVTGGRSFHARDGASLERIVRAIADDLHHQYLLGYVPPAGRAEPGAWRSIAVSVDVPGARARARRGYVAP